MAITIDSKAASKLHEFRDGNEEYLRVSVVGGGCSGFQYKLAFDKPDEKDHVFESNGEKIITDNVSLGFIDGSEITYIDNLSEAGFQVKNPNITGSCGCGSSFYTE
jgi:iron-sulfur cluster assembly accessory protein